MWLRTLEPILQQTRHSILLLGPRQVGKSTLMHQLGPDLSINLASESDFFEFQRNPNELEDRVGRAQPKTVLIDEIQRIPRLTNSIQAMLDAGSKIKFYLTGSSARKLKKGKANLLPGRVIKFDLFPLSASELGKDWSEEASMAYGSLPGVLAEKNTLERKGILKTYSQVYLKEEILAESIVKNTESFARFLVTSSQFAG